MIANVRVTQDIQVTYDPKKFTKEWMANFRKHFYDFHNIEAHLEHIAQCYARGLFSGMRDYLEGYGSLEAMGITCKKFDGDQEIIKRK